MIEDLKKNVNTEIDILREISTYVNRRENASDEEKRLLDTTITSLLASMKIINSSLPALLNEISVAKKLPVSQKKEKETGLTPLSYRRADSQVQVTLASGAREKFLKELSISDSFIRRLKKNDHTGPEKYQEYTSARGYVKFANQFFFPQAQNLIRKGYFKQLALELRRANVDVLFESYVAMMIFSTVLGFLGGIVLYMACIFLTFGGGAIPITLYTGSYLLRTLQFVWVPFAAAAATFGFIYVYPSSERSSLAKKIDQELPFAVIHMSAISGSGIEPSQIFKIIGLSNEYPYLRREFRKVLNQINIYGYDLVTALNNTSKSTPSEKLAGVFSGLSTSITSGASLSDFFSKRAETLLINYALEREKYTKLAETFMDIYISVVIAAPMIFLLLLIIMSIAGAAVQFGPTQLGIIIVGAVSLLNLFFIGFLHMKQPAY